MAPDANPDTVKSRFNMLKAAAMTASYVYREGFRNKKVDVLVESKRERHSGKLTGYSGNYMKVLFDGPDSIMKDIVPVKIEELNLVYTIGSLV
jgi:threonylcarbamoyladenosine tRNA methylthiotransferase MtaB